MNTVKTPQGTCRFSVARRDITPPVGIYHRMWGAATHDRSEGIHRPLMATAMVFGPTAGEGRGNWQVLVALDHCLLLPREMERLTDRLVRAAEVPEQNIIVTFSHTHGAGLMDPGRSNLPGGELIGPYLEDLIEKTGDALSDAVSTLDRVVFTYSTGRCSLAAHRDYRDEKTGEFVCGYNPEGPADDTVLVARITNKNGERVATIVNYGCHPTTLAFDNRLISPDYPGAMRELVEEATGAPCIFLQGASGDLGPREGFVGDPSVADRHGRQLGHAALATLESMPPPGTRYRYRGPVVSGATLGIWEHEELGETERRSLETWRRRSGTIELAYRPELPDLAGTRAEFENFERVEDEARRAGDVERATDARAMAERMRRLSTRLERLPPGKSFPYRITLWQSGDAIWLAVPGEPYNLLQRALRERFPDLPILVLVLAGSWGPSYLPTAETYGTRIYQESVAVVEAGSLERVIDEVERQIGAWQS